MLLANGGAILYVANANRNSVTVFDTSGRALETIYAVVAPGFSAGQHSKQPRADAG